MADVTVNVTQVPAVYTTFDEYVLSGYWEDGYVVSYACPYEIYTSQEFAVTGVSATTAIGTVQITDDMNVDVSGVRAVATVHSVNIWTIINDLQTPNWTAVPTDESPAPVWATVNTVQSANWTQIAV